MKVQFLLLIVIPRYLNSFVISISLEFIVKLIFFIFDAFEKIMPLVFLWLTFSFHFVVNIQFPFCG